MNAFGVSVRLIQFSQSSHVEKLSQAHLGGGNRRLEGRCVGICVGQAEEMLVQQRELMLTAVNSLLQQTEPPLSVTVKASRQY